MKRYSISFDILAPDSIPPHEVLSAVQAKLQEFQISHSRVFPLDSGMTRDYGPVWWSDPNAMRDRDQTLNGEIMGLLKAIRDVAGDDVGAQALSAEATRKVNEVAKRVIKKIDEQ